jgi:4-hydroxy-3-polyprenylbenzoate decarboxylase/2,5-furandicarboxylate decarboxylase 1
MRPRFAGEARQVILPAMASNIRPKWVMVVDPDIDVHSSTEVEWAMAFRVLPHRDVFVVEQLPSGPADPATITLSPDGERISAALALSSAVGVDATLPFGETFSEVADVPGWQDYDFPELKAYQRD